MDRLISNIIIVDDNDTTFREQILAKIIAAALLEQVRIHNNTLIKTVDANNS